MTKERLAAFSDGVIAIIITIMVLELKVPHGAAFSALRPLLSVFLSYVLSFVYVAIYWNNHHHLFYVTERVNGAILWANTHLLFWLSLIPFTTSWLGENHLAPIPTAVYGLNLLACAIAFTILQKQILALHGEDSLLASALGKDLQGKVSPVFYALAFGFAFVQPWISVAFYILVALMWLLPDPRIERIVMNQSSDIDGTKERVER